MDATQTAQLHEAFGGQMSSAELRFCNHLRELFGAFLAGRAQFLSGFMMLSVDLPDTTLTLPMPRDFGPQLLH
jgi:hypothetical protein